MRQFLSAFLFIIVLGQTQGQVFGTQHVISTDVISPWDMKTGDLDNDGDIDICVSSPSDSSLHWIENLGGNNFAEAQEIDNGIWFRQLSLADFDGDGYLDIAAAAHPNLFWYPNNGNGTFGSLELVSDNLSQPNDVSGTDVNADGFPDLILTEWGGNRLKLYLNQDGLSFNLPIVLSEDCFTCNHTHQADLDGDGDIDILSTNVGGSSGISKVSWYENLGNTGMFGPEQVIASEDIGYEFSLTADLDNDGDIDVATMSLEGNRIAWHQNLGNASFGPEQVIYTELSSPSAMTLGDYDGDGDIDIIAATFFVDEIYWFKNNGFGYFQGPYVVNDLIDWPSGVGNADLDGDGDEELLSISRNDNKVAYYDNLSGQGCTDPSACNFDPDAYVDDASCCYLNCGCTMNWADNYDSNASCEDGSCAFTVTGTVFYDENENGILDWGEVGLPLQQVFNYSEDQMLTTNGNGDFLTTVTEGPLFGFVLQQNPLFPYFTTPQSLAFDYSDNSLSQHLYFGISDEMPQYEIDVHLYSPGETYPCNTDVLHTIVIHNSGNVTLDGVVALEMNPLFQGQIEGSPIDSVVDNTVYMSFQGLAPWFQTHLQIDLISPTVEYIGDTLVTFVSVEGFHQGSSVAFGEHSVTKVLACAYDPNDKQVFPPGYSSEHYVQADSILEFLVRFQNTGNAPATDVIIRDILDDHFDISSFELIANSHSVFTTVDWDTREVEFYFQDIQLPDSVNNEPESHGFVSYSIKPSSDTPLLTELNNTARIFFDNNPPIVTNTTWSTLYDCSLFEVDFTQDGNTLIASDGDSYQWYFNNSPIPGETEQTLTVTEFGSYAVEVSTEFPCSGLSPYSTVITSVEEMENQKATLFPNPMSQRAIIDLGTLTRAQALEVYTLEGKLVRSERIASTDRTIEFYRRNITSGQYILIIQTSQGVVELPFAVE